MKYPESVFNFAKTPVPEASSLKLPPQRKPEFDFVEPHRNPPRQPPTPTHARIVGNVLATDPQHRRIRNDNFNATTTNRYSDQRGRGRIRLLCGLFAQGRDPRQSRAGIGDRRERNCPICAPLVTAKRISKILDETRILTFHSVYFSGDNGRGDVKRH